MNNSNRLALATVVALTLGCVAAASARPVITDITASGPGLGSFSSTIDAQNRAIDMDKTFGSVNPITLTFTVVHETGGGNGDYDVTEAITNNTRVPFTDFHLTIVEPPEANGVVFTSFNKSTLSGFTLDSPPASGPRNLNFTGTLAVGGTADAVFGISPFDPSEGSTYTFSIVQTPTVGAIPEPGTWAMFAAGLVGLVGVARRRMG